MIRPPLILLAIYAAFVLEALGWGAAGGIVPQWLIVAAALCTWRLRISLAVLAAGLCGFLLDSLSAGQPGVQTALLALLGWVIATLIRQRRWKSTTALILLATALAFASGLASQLSAGVPAEWSRTTWQPLVLSVAGPAAVTGLWTGGLWLLGRGIDSLFRWILPPLLWRQTAT
jgi:rod shape-determining protein MreD